MAALTGSDFPVRGRAHTPEQKREVIEELLVLWGNNSELRLGQLLANCIDSDAGLYTIEDDDLLRELHTYYEREQDGYKDDGNR